MSLFDAALFDRVIFDIGDEEDDRARRALEHYRLFRTARQRRYEDDAAAFLLLGTP